MFVFEGEFSSAYVCERCGWLMMKSYLVFPFDSMTAVNRVASCNCRPGMLIKAMVGVAAVYLSNEAERLGEA